MTDTDILKKAMARYRSTTHDNMAFKDDVIVFLEKEIDQYREKIERMKMHINAIYGVQSGSYTERIEKTEQRVKTVDEFSESIAEAVQELCEKHNALVGCVYQLGDIVENKFDQFIGDTLTTFTEEHTSDGGTMTLATHTDTNTVQEVLLQNGYFVTSHIDDEPSKQDDETITIEFWRA